MIALDFDIRLVRHAIDADVLPLKRQHAGPYPLGRLCDQVLDESWVTHFRCWGADAARHDSKRLMVAQSIVDNAFGCTVGM